jgi:endonuclease/exonuclease/phosphatase (EEP) superfamily protein YafD
MQLYEGNCRKAVSFIARFFKRVSHVLSVLFLFSGMAFFLLISLIWVNSAGLISSDSPWYGFDYLDTHILILMLVVVLLLGVLTHKTRISALLAVMFLLFYSIHGDHSLWRLSAWHQPEKKTGDCITVLTLNVAQFYHGIDRVTSLLKERNPDVICLQEYDTPGADRRAEIGAAFSPCHVALGEKCDSAIASKYPIEEFHEVQLPSLQPGYNANTPENQVMQHRYFVHAVIAAKAHKINVISFRLIAGRSVDLTVSLREVARWGHYLACEQQREALAVAEYISRLDGPVIFAGDLNAPPNCHVLIPLKKIGTDACLATNMWPACTFPSGRPFSRLDYVFCNGKLKPLSAAVLDLQISDHRPVLATFACGSTHNE